MMGLHDRTRILIGSEGCARLARAHVCVVGLGGVGAYAVEALARAGVGRLTLVEHDRIEVSNLNRQLLALHSTLGASKAAVMTARIRDIHPDCQVVCLEQFLAAENMHQVTDSGCDLILDAIDSLNSKVALLAAALDASLPVISAMGAGGRLDPSALRVSDLAETRVCPLARVVRQRLRRLGHERGVIAVWSEEKPHPPRAPEPTGRGRARVVNGTISYLPALFGLTMAARAIEQLLHSPSTPAPPLPLTIG